jgi:hypothetical protein
MEGREEGPIEASFTGNLLDSGPDCLRSDPNNATSWLGGLGRTASVFPVCKMEIITQSAY